MSFLLDLFSWLCLAEKPAPGAPAATEAANAPDADLIDLDMYITQLSTGKAEAVKIASSHFELKDDEGHSELDDFLDNLLTESSKW